MIFRRIILAIAACMALIGSVGLWWFYGSGISEETAFELATKYAQKYANQNRFNLGLYIQPRVGTQTGNQIYIFSWKPKVGGNPLVISVDARSTEVVVDESSVE